MEQKECVSFSGHCERDYCVNLVATHIDFRRLGEGSYWMDIVVQDDYPDHHPEAETHRLLTGESAPVLSDRTRKDGSDITRVKKEKEKKKT